MNAIVRSQFPEIAGVMDLWRTEIDAKETNMTWAQRAEAGVDAKHFQEALKAKS